MSICVPLCGFRVQCMSLFLPRACVRLLRSPPVLLVRVGSGIRSSMHHVTAVAFTIFRVGYIIALLCCGVVDCFFVVDESVPHIGDSPYFVRRLDRVVLLFRVLFVSRLLIA